jgi:hypothetical protein
MAPSTKRAGGVGAPRPMATGVWFLMQRKRNAEGYR